MAVLFVGSMQTGTLVEAAEPAVASEQIVGRLSYSNQWVFEQTASILYLTANQGTLTSNTLAISHYRSTFSSAQFLYPSLDYFDRLVGFASAESGSQFRKLSLWTRYSLAFFSRQGALSDTEIQLNSKVQNTTLTAVMARVGLTLNYQVKSWLRPYLGFEATPYGYRHSTAISGAESQGFAMILSPVFGIHAPLFFSGRGSIYGEFRRDIAMHNPRQVFATGNEWDGGLGLTF